MTERYQQFESAPMDPIMQANADWPSFEASHPDAINTTIGVVIDQNTGKPWRPQSIRLALQSVTDQTISDSQYGYQAPAGNEELIQGINAISHPNTERKPAVVYQALGGTGALHLTKQALLELIPTPLTGKRSLVLDGGWPNHQNIFGSDFEISSYRHADPETGRYDHQASVDALIAVPDRATVLFQGCGYNDDGLDRSNAEWDEVLSIAAQKEMTVILDMAYTGLTNTYYSDFAPIWNAANKGLFVFANLSMSKNMGLYNERVGALLVLNAEAHLGDQQATRFDQKIKRIIRGTISNPPRLAAQAAGSMLLYNGFHDELAVVREQIEANRATLATVLGETYPIVANGSGLFTKLLPGGFTLEQQAYLKGAGIHALPNSRLNLGGLRASQVERVGTTILRALRSS